VATHPTNTVTKRAEAQQRTSSFGNSQDGRSTKDFWYHACGVALLATPKKLNLNAVQLTVLAQFALGRSAVWQFWSISLHLASFPNQHPALYPKGDRDEQQLNC
jgi:hypothetical protein